MKRIQNSLVLCLFSSLFFGSIAQTIEPDKGAKPFLLDTIVEATRYTDATLQEAQGIVADTASYLNLYNRYVKLLSTNSYALPNDSIFADYTDLSFGEFDRLIIFWTEYSKALQLLDTQTNGYISEISQLVPKLSALRQRWIATGKPTKDGVVGSEAILENSDSYRIKIEQANKRLKLYLDAFIRLNGRIAQHTKHVEVTRAQLAERVANRAKTVFIKDAEPLPAALASDGTTLKSALKSGWEQERAELVAFAKAKYGNMLLHAAFILLLMFVFRLLVKNSKPSVVVNASNSEIAEYITRYPLLAGLLIGLFFARVFYTNPPILFVNALILGGLVPVVAILPRILSRQMPLLAVFLLVLVLLSATVGLLRNSVTYERVALIFTAILTMAVLLLIVPWPKVRRVIILHGGHGVLVIAWFFIVFLFASIIANYIGYAQLGILLAIGVVFSLATALIAFVAVKTSQAVLRMLFTGTPLKMLNICRLYAKPIDRWIVVLTTIVGLLFWARNVLSSFNILIRVQQWYALAVAHTWTFGEVSLSLQNIVDFLFIIAVFYFIANIIHIIIQDELLPRYNLKKGLPLGVSILARYVILFMGFVFAMSAAGISLSKLNLIIGALGVGIGFGLQNIVSNFVSGFVIIFEGTFQIGDTVSTTTLEGEVTAVGLRSSRIRTYDGADVTVPNNNLITNEVINWTTGDTKRRYERFVLIEGSSNPRHVKQIIDGVLKSHEGLVAEDKNLAYFLGYENTALKFRVLFWLRSGFLNIPSQVLLNVHEALTSNGYKPYIPVQKVILNDSAALTQKVIGNNPELENSDTDAIN